MLVLHFLLVLPALLFTLLGSRPPLSEVGLGAIIFLISARWYHITIQIYNFSENIRFGLASVLATALIFIVLAVFGLMRLIVKQSEHLEKTVTVQ